MKYKLIIMSGIILILFGLIPSPFWERVDWQEELLLHSTEDNNIIQSFIRGTVCLFLSLISVIIFYRSETGSVKLGQVLLLPLTLFFLGRLIWKFIFQEKLYRFGINSSRLHTGYL